LTAAALNSLTVCHKVAWEELATGGLIWLFRSIKGVQFDYSRQGLLAFFVDYK